MPENPMRFLASWAEREGRRGWGGGVRGLCKGVGSGSARVYVFMCMCVCLWPNVSVCVCARSCMSVFLYTLACALIRML